MGQPRFGRRRLRPGGRAHAIENVDVRNDRRANARVLNIARDVSADDGAAGQADFLIAAGVIRMVMRVDDVPDGTR